MELPSSTLKSFIGQDGDNSLKVQVAQMMRSWVEQNYESIKVEEGDIVLCQTFKTSVHQAAGGSE